jgi:hypothetical protein
MTRRRADYTFQGLRVPDFGELESMSDQEEKRRITLLVSRDGSVGKSHVFCLGGVFLFLFCFLRIRGGRCSSFLDPGQQQQKACLSTFLSCFASNFAILAAFFASFSTTNSQSNNAGRGKLRSFCVLTFAGAATPFAAAASCA